MHRLIRRVLGGTVAGSAAVLLLVSCAGSPTGSAAGRTADETTGPSSAGTDLSDGADPSAPAALAAPAARQQDGTGLPLVAGQWGDGRRKTPPRRLGWERPADGGEGSAASPLKVTVTAASAPSYVSFMLHSRIDESGIPDEDTRRQKILACGAGISEPGCRIKENGDRSYTIETVGAPPAGHPYRVLYVQWAPDRPGAEETWASWQLPTGWATRPQSTTR
ncbi:hypothetical protein ACFV16_05875 [Streptomyces massasporeus]|uniref:hypothetical protein n=1 Tax=Streptomyces massasporeus TaxID=67324 RepID=UPI003680E876